MKPDVIILPYGAKSPEKQDLLKQIHAFNHRIMVVFMDEYNETLLEAAMKQAERRKARQKTKEAIMARIQSFWAAIIRFVVPTHNRVD